MEPNTGIRELTFTLKKETKGTHVYEETPSPNSAPVVGSLYVRKGSFNPPASILKVTIVKQA